MDGLDDLLEQVMKALDFKDPSIRAKLRRGLEQGFEQAELGAADMHFEFDLDDEFAGPAVTVLDGGLDERAPPSGDRPDLEVLDGRSDEPEVSVRVVRSTTTSSPIGGAGCIDVRERQTLYRGTTPRPYRVFCGSGAFQLMIDGVGVEQLEPGQSIDIEAGLIQVRGEGSGSYERL